MGPNQEGEIKGGRLKDWGKKKKYLKSEKLMIGSHTNQNCDVHGYDKEVVAACCCSEEALARLHRIQWIKL